MSIAAHPFGITIKTEDLIDTLSFFDDWESRYKYIIDLGKQLPTLGDNDKTDEHLVRGCQSSVWIVHEAKDGALYFHADSDAVIVRGLLAVVLCAYNGKTPEEIRAFDIEGYFSALDLLRHLSATRGNGLKAMVQRILHTAQMQS